MKCFGCGYEKRTESYPIEKVIRYQSGKRKGEVKDIVNETINPDIDKTDFIEISVEKGFDFVADEGFRFMDPARIELFACPECGTVRMGK